ncbi:dihydroorotase [Marinospirillum sp. MEB164]|uniref:Dihydroorotase n=1 Tax=Marinospirillum alkalitolerans TaxID=3123374 RepID=A0ABW8PVI8_9GAMM
MKLTIQGARVIDPAAGLDQVQDVHLHHGQLMAIGAAPSDFHADETLVADGWLATPGWIDLSCHLRDPGPSYKGNLKSETLAALAGGFTQVCARPDTQPPLDSPALVQALREKAQQAAQAQVWPVGGLTQGLEGQLLSNMAALQAAGCVAVTNMRQPVQDFLVMRRCLEYAATFDLPVILYPEEPSLVAGGCAHEGAMASQLGLQGIPETAETLAVAQWLLLIEQAGVRAHFSHLSTARSVELLAAAQAKGLPVSADVALTHLVYTDSALEDFDSHFHLQPPLRREEDRRALMAGVQAGVISAISSGHLPHERAAKMAPFAASEPGQSTLEVCLPLLLERVAAQELSLPTLIERMTLGPALALGLPMPRLQAHQDLILIDPEEVWTPATSSWQSAGRNTPVWQQPLKGRVKQVWAQGHRHIFS